MPFDYQPTLRDELVELRPLRAGDFDGLHAAASDPLTWAQHPVRNRHERAVFQAYFDDALASGGALVVLDASTGRIIGSSRFHGYDAEASEVEIGWTFLARSHWGGVYNGAMKRLMIRHALELVDSVILLVGPENGRSQRAVEKIGGVRIGVRPDDTGLESYAYAITAATLQA